MTRRIPQYRHYKPKDLGLVVLGGKQYYLGKHGTTESLARYHRLVQDWLAAPSARKVPEGTADALTVDELILAFWERHVTVHYRHPDGTPTGEQRNFLDSLRPLRRLYGGTAARDFGPLALRSVRDEMIRAGLARSTINQRIGRVTHLFKWAVEHELVPPTIHQALRAVEGLRKGRSAARETDPVRPVGKEQIDAIRPHVAPQIWAMVELQQLTGMRPGEVTAMRGCDIDRSRSPWLYTPAAHKMAYAGRPRRISLGPRAREILDSWLRPDQEQCLFRPSEAAVVRRALRTGPHARPSPRIAGSRRLSAPRRLPGERYSVKSYHHAIRRACLRAGVVPWHPNQLRHTAATRIRRDHGLDVARAVLGHVSPAVTEIYAEIDLDRAVAVMEQDG